MSLAAPLVASLVPPSSPSHRIGPGGVLHHAPGHYPLALPHRIGPGMTPCIPSHPLLHRIGPGVNPCILPSPPLAPNRSRGALMSAAHRGERCTASRSSVQHADMEEAAPGRERPCAAWAVQRQKRCMRGDPDLHYSALQVPFMQPCRSMVAHSCSHARQWWRLMQPCKAMVAPHAAMQANGGASRPTLPPHQARGLPATSPVLAHRMRKTRPIHRASRALAFPTAVAGNMSCMHPLCRLLLGVGESVPVLMWALSEIIRPYLLPC